MSKRINGPDAVENGTRQTSVVPAREAMIALKNKKTPTAMIPLGDFV